MKIFLKVLVALPLASFVVGILAKLYFNYLELQARAMLSPSEIQAQCDGECFLLSGFFGDMLMYLFFGIGFFFTILLATIFIVSKLVDRNNLTQVT